jgi:hypothetical protein
MPTVAPEVTPDADIAQELAETAGEMVDAQDVQAGATVAAPPPNPVEASDQSDEPANA